MKKISKMVKIGIKDNDKSVSNRIKNWIKNYNIQYYHSNHSLCLYSFPDAKNLKVIALYDFHSFEEKDLNVFLQLVNLHSLIIFFKMHLK